MKRVFTVWNQGYKHRLILADDHVEALNLCAKAKFIRRVSLFRKFEDSTDRLLDEPLGETLGDLLAGDASGSLSLCHEKGWHLN